MFALAASPIKDWLGSISLFNSWIYLKFSNYDELNFFLSWSELDKICLVNVQKSLIHRLPGTVHIFFGSFCPQLSSQLFCRSLSPSKSQMACFFVVIFVLLSCTSGSPAYKNHQETKESYFSPKKVCIDIFCLFLGLALNYSWSWIYLSPKCHSFQRGRGFHCWHRRDWGRIQREDWGGPKQANGVVWSSRRSSWCGSQWHLAWFQTSKFQFPLIVPSLF